jgi:hypothetical protein
MRILQYEIGVEDGYAELRCAVHAVHLEILL